MPPRLGAAIDRAQAFAARHERALGVLSTAWLMAVAFSYAGFVPLPDIALLHGTPALIASSAWNAGWWGFIRPALARRKAASKAGQATVETV